MRKSIQISLLFLLCLLCSCSYSKLTTEQIDELFKTDFSFSGLYRQDDEYLFSKEPVYHLAGNFFNSNYSGVVKISKSDRVHVYPAGEQLMSEEILELNGLALHVSIVTKETIGCPDGFAEPYFLIEYETEQGFFGIRLTKNLSNLYAEGEQLKENDKTFILELIEKLHFKNKAQENQSDTSDVKINSMGFHQYALNVYNHQDTFYKNSTLIMLLDVDSDLSKYKTKVFRMEPVVEIQMKKGEEWKTVQSIEISGISEKEAEAAEIIFSIELSDIDYSDGNYRIKASVYENEKAAELVSKDMIWKSADIQNQPLSSSEYLKLYPFSLYADHHLFSQNHGNIKEAAKIQVLPKGCAVLAEDVDDEQIHHVSCAVLNPDVCQFIHVNDYLPKTDSSISGVRFEKGLRDEELYHSGHQISAESLVEWIQSELDDAVVIPNCFDLTYEFGEQELYSFEYLVNSETIRLSVINIEGQQGSLVTADQLKGREYTVLASMWIPSRMTESVFAEMLK